MKNRFRVPSLLVPWLKEFQVSLPEVLKRAGLPADFLRQEKVYASTEQFFALWRSIAQAIQDPAIGLKLGSESRFERFVPSAIAALCSQSLRDALQRLARYKQITCPEEIRIQTRGAETSVEFIFLEADENAPPILIDICLARVLSIGSRGTGRQIKPVRMELTRPVKYRRLLETHFGCTVHFDARRDAIVYRTADLDLPFVTYNEDLLNILGAQLETELNSLSASQTITEQIHQVLKRTLAGRRPDIQLVARELGLSSRTLQRRLTDTGVTFQELVEKVRRELAIHYLSRKTIELNEAAYLLGYEDASSFFRAFQTWEGTTPGTWREKNCRTA